MAAARILGFMQGKPTMQQEILQAIWQTAYVPSMPAAATRFIELCMREDPEFDDLVDVLSTDPGMASEILRLANSPFFGITKRIHSLKLALTLLGLVKVRSLVMGRYLVQEMDKLECPALNHTHYWRRSITCATLAARFSEAGGEELEEEAFICGLLADIGVVVLAGAVPDRYETIAREYQPLHGDRWVKRELHHLGISHATVSGLILHDWHFPADIVEAVRCHHDNLHLSPDMRRFNRIACLVGAASDAVELLLEVRSPDRTRELCSRASAKSGLELDALIGAMLSIEDHLADLAFLLRIRIEPTKTRDLIARELKAQFQMGHRSGHDDSNWP